MRNRLSNDLLPCPELGRSLRDPINRTGLKILIPKARRQKVAPGPVPAGPLVELPGGDVVGNQPDLFQVFGQRLRASLGEVPFDARFFGLDQNAERDLLALRLRERVGGQLVGERRLVIFVVGARRLEVDHGEAVVHLAHEVDDADEGSVQRGHAEFKLSFHAERLPDFGSLVLKELLE